MPPASFSVLSLFQLFQVPFALQLCCQFGLGGNRFSFSGFSKRTVRGPAPTAPRSKNALRTPLGARRRPLQQRMQAPVGDEPFRAIAKLARTPQRKAPSAAPRASVEAAIPLPAKLEDERPPWNSSKQRVASVATSREGNAYSNRDSENAEPNARPSVEQVVSLGGAKIPRTPLVKKRDLPPTEPDSPQTPPRRAAAADEPAAPAVAGAAPAPAASVVPVLAPAASAPCVLQPTSAAPLPAVVAPPPPQPQPRAPQQPPADSRAPPQPHPQPAPPPPFPVPAVASQDPPPQHAPRLSASDTASRIASLEREAAALHEAAEERRALRLRLQQQLLVLKAEEADARFRAADLERQAAMLAVRQCSRRYTVLRCSALRPKLIIFCTHNS